MRNKITVSCEFNGEAWTFTGMHRGGPVSVNSIMMLMWDQIVAHKAQVPRLISEMDKVAETMNKVAELLFLVHFLPDVTPYNLSHGRTGLRLHDVNIGYIWIERV